MYKKLFAALAAMTMTGVGSASAADMKLKAPPVAPPPVFSWTGCYIGANFGGKIVDPRGTVTTQPVTAGGLTIPGVPFSLDDGGQYGTLIGIGGGQLGCNYQAGTWVFGIEGDIDVQDYAVTRRVGPPDLLPGTLLVTGDSFDLRSRWEASVRGRLGYALDRLLIYATGGVGFFDLQVNSNWIPVVVGGTLFPGTFASERKTLIGPTVGGGVEYAVLQNVSLGLEGRYSWYGTHTFNSGSVAAIATTPGAAPVFAFTPTFTTVRLNTWEVTGRVNWKFWTP